MADPNYVPVVAARILETRVGQENTTIDGLFQGVGQSGEGGVTELNVAGRAGVPSDASAVVLNVTSVDAVASGYITVWPCGSDQPWTSNLNLSAGATIPNAVISKVGAGGNVCIFTSKPTDLVVDINGYFG